MSLPQDFNKNYTNLHLPPFFRSANKHHMRRRDSLSPALNNKTAARFNLLSIAISVGHLQLHLFFIYSDLAFHRFLFP